MPNPGPFVQGPVESVFWTLQRPLSQVSQKLTSQVQGVEREDEFGRGNSYGLP